MQTIIYIGSDGGATDGLGIFEWIIATDTRILVEGYGHALVNYIKWNLHELNHMAVSQLSCFYYITGYTIT